MKHNQPNMGNAAIMTARVNGVKCNTKYFHLNFIGGSDKKKRLKRLLFSFKKMQQQKSFCKIII